MEQTPANDPQDTPAAPLHSRLPADDQLQDAPAPGPSPGPTPGPNPKPNPNPNPNRRQVASFDMLPDGRLANFHSDDPEIMREYREMQRNPPAALRGRLPAEAPAGCTVHRIDATHLPPWQVDPWNSVHPDPAPPPPPPPPPPRPRHPPPPPPGSNSASAPMVGPAPRQPSHNPTPAGLEPLACRAIDLRDQMELAALIARQAVADMAVARETGGSDAYGEARIEQVDAEMRVWRCIFRIGQLAGDHEVGLRCRRDALAALARSLEVAVRSRDEGDGSPD